MTLADVFQTVYGEEIQTNLSLYTIIWLEMQKHLYSPHHITYFDTTEKTKFLGYFSPNSANSAFDIQVRLRPLEIPRPQRLALNT